MVHITEKNFQKEVIDSETPVLVDCWHGSCSPCLNFMDELNKIDETYPSLKVVKLNVFNNTTLARALFITSVPTFLVYKAGKVFDCIVGTARKALYTALDNVGD